MQNVTYCFSNLIRLGNVICFVDELISNVRGVNKYFRTKVSYKHNTRLNPMLEDNRFSINTYETVVPYDLISNFCGVQLQTRNTNLFFFDFEPGPYQYLYKNVGPLGLPLGLSINVIMSAVKAVLKSEIVKELLRKAFPWSMGIITQSFYPHYCESFNLWMKINHS